jgi:hypothetical protein
VSRAACGRVAEQGLLNETAQESLSAMTRQKQAGTECRAMQGNSPSGATIEQAYF